MFFFKGFVLPSGGNVGSWLGEVGLCDEALALKICKLKIAVIMILAFIFFAKTVNIISPFINTNKDFIRLFAERSN